LASARSPLIRAAEYPSDYRRAAPGAVANTGAEAEALAHVYQVRWRPVASALQEFDAQTLEAEALWGPEIRQTTKALRACVVTLFAAMEAIVDDKDAGGDHFEADREFGRRMRANAHAAAGAADNALSDEIAAAVTALEERVRPHLTRTR
jgi:hypothetical protein